MKKLNIKSLYRQDPFIREVNRDSYFIDALKGMFPLNEDINYKKSVIQSVGSTDKYFCVNMDDIWHIFFKRKDGMVKYMLNEGMIVEGIDFIVKRGDDPYGSMYDKYMLSIPFVYWMFYHKYWIYGYDIIGFNIIVDWDLISCSYSRSELLFENIAECVGLSIDKDYVIIPHYVCMGSNIKRRKIMISLNSISSIYKYLKAFKVDDGFGTYIIKDYIANIYKIGKSVDVYERLKQIRCCNPHILLYAYLDKNVETELHNKYSRNRLSPNCEWFNLSDGDLNNIVNEYNFTLSPSRHIMKFNEYK